MSYVRLGCVKLACKDPSFAQSLFILANQIWQLPEWRFQTLTYMFYKLPLQIQTIEGTQQYKIAPLTPPNVSIVTRLFSVYTLYWRNNQIHYNYFGWRVRLGKLYRTPQREQIIYHYYILCPMCTYLCNVRPGQASQD